MNHFESSSNLQRTYLEVATAEVKIFQDKVVSSFRISDALESIPEPEREDA